MSNSQITRIDATPQQYDINDIYNPKNVFVYNSDFSRGEYYRAEDSAVNAFIKIYINPSLDFRVKDFGFNAMTFNYMNITLLSPNGEQDFRVNAY
jgi:hypothetical protein